ncbi:non-ribosomal peptide synthetase, partial [Pseudoalteromonas umbrosa]|uniref:non-ribosomal peptide synthetase n=1 Tax=Pseudoalteromonas umbrosa TaxID=3048489 RepID=UPI0024C33237
GPIQVVQDAAHLFSMPIIDLQNTPHSQQHAQISQLINQEAKSTFDLSCDLMLRSQYIQLAKDEGVLLLTMHHIASDGTSFEVFIREFMALYQAVPLPALPIQYIDYAHWQSEWLSEDVLAKQLTYWQTQLADAPLLHSLPLDKPRPDVATYEGDVLHGKVSAEQSQAVQALAKRTGATPFMVLHSVLALVLARHSFSRDIVLGTVVANRMQPELAQLIGFFVNTLALRTSVDFTRFDELLAHVIDVNLDAQSNQDVPFEQVVEHLGVSRSLQHNPVFQIMFSVANSIEQGPSQEMNHGLQCDMLQQSEHEAKFDLSLDARISAQGISFTWLYSTALFERATIARLQSHVETVLAHVLATPDCLLSQLPMLSAQEQQTLHQLAQPKTAPEPKHMLIHQWFDQQAALHPQAMALHWQSSTLSYQALQHQSNLFCHYLQAHHIGASERVAVFTSPDVHLLGCILGILKSGAAYVPLDPSLPADRIAWILEDANITQVFGQRACLEAQSLPEHVESLAFESLALDDYDLGTPQYNGHTEAQLAYVIYTSGSTGQPKGVMMSHGSLARRMASFRDVVPMQGQDRFLSLASLAFDISLFEWLYPLLHGGQVRLVCKEDILDMAQLQ